MTNYNIKQYSYAQAKKLGVSIFPSKKPNKKIDVYKDGIYACSIGDKGAMDYPSYILNPCQDISFHQSFLWPRF